MIYDIHPILVHFPIAFLCVYSIIKILPLEKWFPSISWKQIEQVLLVVGILGALAALGTGENAEHISRPNHQLVEMHSNFATLATMMYGFLLAGETIMVGNQKYFTRITTNQKILTIWHRLEIILCNPIITKIVAFLGLLAILMTGLLGGAMVYGTSADPFAGVVLKLLGISF